MRCASAAMLRLLCLVLCLLGAARADEAPSALPLIPAPPSKTEAPPRPQPAGTRDVTLERRIEDRRRAAIRHHLEVGGRLSVRGRHAEAARAFALAHALEPRPEVLLRVATSYRKAELDLEALAIYEALLQEGLPAAQQAPVREEVAALSAKVDDPEAGLAQALKEYLEAGKGHFQAGRYAQAGEMFAAAYAIKRLPRFLFNIAQAYRRSGQPYEAIVLYRSFLQEDPQTALRKETGGYISELTAMVRAQQGPVYKRWWFWSALGLATAGAVAGILAGTLTRSNIPGDIELRHGTWVPDP